MTETLKKGTRVTGSDRAKLAADLKKRYDSGESIRALAATTGLQDYGLPILIGISRKSIFGALLGATVDGRLIGTIAANLVTAIYGAKVFRVHDPAEHRAAFTVLDAIAGA